MKSPLKALLFLILILCVFFFPAVTGRRTLLLSVNDAPSILAQGAYGKDILPSPFHRTPDDISPANFTEPLLKVVGRQWWKEHVFPLWNPYNGFGSPLAADMQSQPFNPLVMLLSADCTPYTYNLFLLLRLLIAGFFTYLFAAYFLDRMSALFSAIAFMFCGYYILFLNMPHLSVEVLLPAYFWGLERMLRVRDRKNLPILSITVFLIMAGGMPESALLVLGFGMMYFFYRLFTDRTFSGQRTRLSLGLGLAVVLGLGLAAILLVPFFELLRQSYDLHRNANAQGNLPGLTKDKGFCFAITYLLPFIFGPTYENPVLGITFIRGYTGILVALFAFLSLLLLGRPRQTKNLFWLVLFLAVCSVLMLLKRYGIPPAQWLGRLPILNLVIFQKYQEPLLEFGLALLAGAGLFALRRQTIPSRQVGLVLGLFLIAFLASGFFFIGFFEEASWRGSLFYANLGLGIVLILITGGLYFLLRKRPVVLGAVFIILLMAEMFFNFLYPCFYLPDKLPLAWQDPYQGAPFIGFLQAHTKDHSRVFGQDNILNPNWAGVFGLEDVRLLEAFYTNRYMDFMNNFLREPGSETRFLELSSVRYLMAEHDLRKAGPAQTKGLPNLRQVYDQEVKIFEAPRCLPRACVFEHVTLAKDGPEALKILKEPKFDPWHSAVITLKDVAGDTQQLVDLINSNKKPVAAQPQDLAEYGSQRAVIRAKINKPGFLMFTDAYYPGWRAFVDGRETKIVPANYLFRGVFLEKGRHEIQFIYQPSSFRWGVIISLASVLFIVLLALGGPIF